MATTDDLRIKSEQLFQELGIWKFTVSGYSNLFDKNPFTKEFLAFKIDIARGFIEESHSWGKTANKTKCKNAIDNAELYLGQIQVLFDSMFADQYQETWQDMKEEPIFTDDIHVS